MSDTLRASHSRPALDGLPSTRGTALDTRRIVAGFVVTIVAGPLLTLLLLSVRSRESITAEVLSYQLLVVVVAMVGGVRPAVLAAVLSGIALDVLFVAPQFSITIEHPLHMVALVLYVAIAVLVSLIVNQAARRERTAARAKALAETDQVRTALLSALSHDLRRPLAAAVAAVGGLRTTKTLSERDRAELLQTADESLGALTTLITDLLDVSRVQAGVLAVSAMPTDAAGAVLAALDELSLGPGAIELHLDTPDIQQPLPPLHADPVLLQRVLVNLLLNATTHSTEGAPVRVELAQSEGRGEVRIIDRGPGVRADRREEIFQPFQRFGDVDNDTGLGLGLALSRGFTEGMGGTLTPVDTPGGGLTMIVSLPFAEKRVSV